MSTPFKCPESVLKKKTWFNMRTPLLEIGATPVYSVPSANSNGAYNKKRNSSENCSNKCNKVSGPASHVSDMVERSGNGSGIKAATVGSNPPRFTFDWSLRAFLKPQVSNSNSNLIENANSPLSHAPPPTMNERPLVKNYSKSNDNQSNPKYQSNSNEGRVVVKQVSLPGETRNSPPSAGRIPTAKPYSGLPSLNGGELIGGLHAVDKSAEQLDYKVRNCLKKIRELRMIQPLSRIPDIDNANLEPNYSERYTSRNNGNDLFSSRKHSQSSIKTSQEMGDGRHAFDKSAEQLDYKVRNSLTELREFRIPGETINSMPRAGRISPAKPYSGLPSLNGGEMGDGRHTFDKSAEQRDYKVRNSLTEIRKLRIPGETRNSTLSAGRISPAKPYSRLPSLNGGEMGDRLNTFNKCAEQLDYKVRQYLAEMRELRMIQPLSEIPDIENINLEPNYREKYTSRNNDLFSSRKKSQSSIKKSQELSQKNPPTTRQMPGEKHTSKSTEKIADRNQKIISRDMLLTSEGSGSDSATQTGLNKTNHMKKTVDNTENIKINSNKDIVVPSEPSRVDNSSSGRSNGVTPMSPLLSSIGTFRHPSSVSEVVPKKSSPSSTGSLGEDNDSDDSDSNSDFDSDDDSDYVSDDEKQSGERVKKIYKVKTDPNKAQSLVKIFALKKTCFKRGKGQIIIERRKSSSKASVSSVSKAKIVSSSPVKTVLNKPSLLCRIDLSRLQRIPPPPPAKQQVARANGNYSVQSGSHGAGLQRASQPSKASQQHPDRGSTRTRTSSFSRSSDKEKRRKSEKYNLDAEKRFIVRTNVALSMPEI